MLLTADFFFYEKGKVGEDYEPQNTVYLDVESAGWRKKPF